MGFPFMVQYGYAMAPELCGNGAANTISREVGPEIRLHEIQTEGIADIDITYRILNLCHTTSI